jgi:hypothetical protein
VLSLCHQVVLRSRVPVAINCLRALYVVPQQACGKNKRRIPRHTAPVRTSSKQKWRRVDNVLCIGRLLIDHAALAGWKRQEIPWAFFEVIFAVEHPAFLVETGFYPTIIF